MTNSENRRKSESNYLLFKVKLLLKPSFVRIVSLHKNRKETHLNGISLSIEVRYVRGNMNDNILYSLHLLSPKSNASVPFLS